jgi:NADH:ubiquinone oxidoreductase subunit 4 (subunit M)
MANIGLPGTSSFIGEFLILTGSFQSNTSITLIGASSMVIGGCYSLWLFNRISYGNLKTQHFIVFLDVNKLEFLIFLPLIFGTILMGLLPVIFLNYLHMSVNSLIEFIYF